MSADRYPARKRAAAPARAPDGRYVRWSYRYHTYQVLDRLGEWRNIREPLADAYIAAGFPFREIKPQRELF